ncbi:MAG TPA: transposase [Burkholderiaceae bacterium]|nr:transposase [Burkholderiaceae bacterium]
MARLARLSAANEAHLLVQRGNNGQATFIDDDDRKAFLALLRNAALDHRVAIHAYALTDNEVMLLATPAGADGLSRMMQGLGRRYVARFNRRHGRSGTLWEGRFRSTVIESALHLRDCMCFVELAPVRAGLVQAPADHPWSSARHHLGQASDPVVTDAPLYWATGNTPFEREVAHQRLLERALTSEQALAIDEAARKGWVYGSDGFAARLESEISRRARPRRPGRPRGRARGASD